MINELTDIISNTQDMEIILQTLNDTSFFFITDDQGILQFANTHFCQLLKESDKHLIGQHLFNNVISVYPKTLSVLDHPTDAQKLQRGELQLTSTDDTSYWISVTRFPFNPTSNKKSFFLWVGTDMTDQKQMENAFSRSLKELQDIKNALDESSIVAITTNKGVITDVNDKFCQTSKYKREELIGKTHRVINSGYHPKSFFQDMWNTIQAKKVWRGEVKNRAKDGTEYWMSTTIVPFLDDEGEPYQFVAIRTDITDRVHAELALAEALHNDFRRTIKNLQNCVFKMQRNQLGDIVFSLSEGKMVKKYHLTTEHVENKTPFDIFPDETANTLMTHFSKAFQGIYVNFEFTYYRRSFVINLSPITENGIVQEVVGSATDITDRKRYEQTIYRMAHYDSLTGLPNRTMFIKELTTSLQQAKKTGNKIALMFIDLDYFKKINDTLGHAIGDSLLIQVSKRLQKQLRKGDIISRFGGDEFVVLLKDIKRDDVDFVAKRLLASLSMKFDFGRTEVYTSPSIGISIFPDHGKDQELLLKNADIAMYVAKQNGKNTYQFFNQELQDSLSRKLSLEIDLRKAIKQQQLQVYYQPKISALTNEIVGAEALVRWFHPELGFISPTEFIPIAEENGLISSIGDWVLTTACQQMKQWHEQGSEKLTISVNVSLRQFMQSNFALKVQHVLKETQLDTKYLELEITESMTVDVNFALTILQQLKNLGIQISIDDFGTGYSSLKHLSDFPIDQLKIDQSFVRDLNEKNQAIIKTIINLAHNMGLAVIAEGVETKQHATFLKEQMCNQLQGYFFSRPLPPDEFSQLIFKN
ncbi:EAL domain-containing protein [Bacillus sp. FJAT-42315]|uniref:EAL domain-containing protein n=1 Tax=Bacillus sp. FJAT-42315 TaxID=2014077 RepID=UPI000C23C8EB|nr:EAL domain-containing protein [Bacillus sp. FJAT-42315]